MRPLDCAIWRVFCDGPVPLGHERLGSHRRICGKSAHASKTGCSQLTKAQVQPLIVNPITKVTVKAVTAEQYTGGTQRIGQECVFAAGSSDSEALTVTVISGPVAARAYAADVQGLGRSSCRARGGNQGGARPS